jgi:hypothetical protein
LPQGAGTAFHLFAVHIEVKDRIFPENSKRCPPSRYCRRPGKSEKVAPVKSPERPAAVPGSRLPAKGRYLDLQVSGKVKKISATDGTIVLTDGCKIKTSDITNLSILSVE